MSSVAKDVNNSEDSDTGKPALLFPLPWLPWSHSESRQKVEPGQLRMCQTSVRVHDSTFMLLDSYSIKLTSNVKSQGVNTSLLVNPQQQDPTLQPLNVNTGVE